LANIFTVFSQIERCLAEVGNASFCKNNVVLCYHTGAASLAASEGEAVSMRGIFGVHFKEKLSLGTTIESEEVI
jgi:hypothetical protein